MRCVDVIRELAGLTGAVEPADVAEHLAHCPGCASWARRNGALDQLWEATRPSTPSGETWDSAWSRIAEALDREPAPELLPMQAPAASRSRRSLVLAFWLAQAAAAAAVLIAVLVHTPAGRPGADVSQLPVASPNTVKYQVECEQGELLVIRFDNRGSVKTTDLALNESPARVDSAFEALNDFEGNAVQ
jgi:hypothetical protein